MQDIRSFRNFLKVVDLGSLSRAAEHVGLTQPALSQQVASLEAEFDVPLLYRTPKGVIPTEAGRILYDRLQALLRQYEAVHDDIASSRSSPRGAGIISLPDSVAEILSAPLLRLVQEKFPNIFIRISAMPSRLIREYLTSNRTDIAVMFGEDFGKGVRSISLVSERLFLLCANDSELAASDGVIDLQELSGQKLVLPCQPHQVGQMVEAYLATNSVDLQIVAEIDGLSNLIALAASGQYVSILPWSAVYRAVKGGQLHARPLPDIMERTLSVCVSELVPLTEAGRAVLELLIEQLEMLVSSEMWRGARLVERDRKKDIQYLLTGVRRS